MSKRKKERVRVTPYLRDAVTARNIYITENNLPHGLGVEYT